MSSEKKSSAHKSEDEQPKAKHSASAVDGIGGTGGASGAGGVSAEASEIGDISGIDPQLEPGDIPAPGASGRGELSGRTGKMRDGGMAGKTRGDDSESVPNQENSDKI